MKKPKNISVLGDGGWGTTLAAHLVKKNYSVKLWGPFPGYLRGVEKSRINRKFLPGIKLPQKLLFEPDLASALNSDLIVFAIPSKFAASVLRQIRRSKVDLSNKIFLSVTKGIDTMTLLRMSQIIYKELGRILLVVLSGPTIAREVALHVPSTAVVASKNVTLAKTIQKVFNSSTFRIYRSTDVVGVELGGSVKNVIAIACGICDGLGYGTNTKAAILTRGLVEMARLGKAMGAREKTFSGLSGLGDLVTTCVNPQSRNRIVGEKLGHGQSIKKILSSMEMVAEGVDTVKAVHALSRKYKIDMPISNEVYQIICKNKKSHKGVSELMARKTKSEN